jgi:WD40 repeat protein
MFALNSLVVRLLRSGSCGGALAILTLAGCGSQAAAQGPAAGAKEMLRGHLKGPKGRFNQLAFSPDGKLVAAGLLEGATISVFDVAQGKEKVRLQMPDRYPSHVVAFSADGRTLVSAAHGDEVIRTWDVRTGRQLREVKRPGARFLGFTPGAQRMVLEEPRVGRGLDLFEVRTGRRVRQFEIGDSTVPAFSPDGKALATIGRFGEMKLWDVERGTLLRVLRKARENGDGYAGALRFSPDGTHLVVADHFDYSLRVVEVASGKERLRLSSTNRFRAGALSPDGTLLATASHEGLALFDLVNDKTMVRLDAVAQGSDVCFSPDGSLLAVAGSTLEQEAAITLFDMPRQRRVPPLPGDLNDEQLETLWNDLSVSNDFKLQRVLGTLRGVPKRSVSFLEKKLQPVSEAQRKRVQGLIRALDDDYPHRREKAMEDLQGLAADFEPLLSETREKQEPGEVRNRLHFVLRRQREAAVPRPLLTQLRAVGVLEEIATPGARALLQALAGGAAGARVTQEATEALARLKQKGE